LFLIKLRVPQTDGNFLNTCTTNGFARRAMIYGVSLVTRFEIFTEMIGVEILQVAMPCSVVVGYQPSPFTS